MSGGADRDYDALYRSFRWDIPAEYNIGVDVCDRHADGRGRLALIFVDENGAATRYSFDDLRKLSNRFANVLRADGLVRGDRLAVFLAQSPEAGIAHVAAHKSGMIAVPLFALFGQDALEFRLRDSSAKAVITDDGGLSKILGIRDRLPDLVRIYVIGDRADGTVDRSFSRLIERASDAFTPIKTSCDDPATIIYTSGTTGNPKGALLPHRVLLGHLPCVSLSHELFPQPGDLIWTPADWAWIGGLFDVLLPAWHFGVPVVGHRAAKFDPEAALRLMATHNVRNVFMPPTALKLIRQSGVENSQVRLRSIASGGETLGTELLDWARKTFGVTLNEFYGQTECNLIASNCSTLFPVRPGSLGRPVLGHDVRIVDDSGVEIPRGQVGNIGVRRGDPVMFLGYWNNPKATAAKFAGDFLLTGDFGHQDDDNYIWFKGREDDLITSGGYRIGPGEVEDCLVKHPAVALAAVVGVPDPVRTEAVKAWIVLRAGFPPSDDLAREIQTFVKQRLAAHEYPRQIAFVDALPMTVTGKIVRRELRPRV